MKLRELQGLGPKSEKCLNDIGIFTKEDLEKIGPIKAYIKLRDESKTKPSLNFLYAMVGALENENWVNIAQNEKGRLIMELDGYRELQELFERDGIKVKI